MVGKSIAIDYPELEPIPFEKIGAIVQYQTGRGIGTRKVRFALNYLRKGFSLPNAAAHPNCPSARYFLNKLQSLNY